MRRATSNGESVVDINPTLMIPMTIYLERLRDVVFYRKKVVLIAIANKPNLTTMDMDDETDEATASGFASYTHPRSRNSRQPREEPPS